jgi:hypothetical protein
MRLRIVLAGVLLAACSRSTAEQPSPEELRRKIESLSDGQSVDIGDVRFTMHRKATGIPAANGWVEATSTGCGFTVLLPGPFNDFSQSAPTTDGSTLHTHAVGTRTIEGDKFTALCLTRDDGRIPADWALHSAAALKKGHTVLNSQPISLPGLEGFDLHVAAPSGARMFARYLRSVDHAYQLTLEYPSSSGDYAPDLAPVFLNSLRVRAVPQSSPRTTGDQTPNPSLQRTPPG